MKRFCTKFKKLTVIKLIYKYLFQFLSLFPNNFKIIIFESFLGKQFSDNPRAIYEYIKENYPQYKLYWSIDHRYSQNFKDKEINIVHRFSLKWLILMASSKYWISNSRMPSWIPKPKHTTYLQTWHGTPLKRLALDMEEVYMPGKDIQSYKNEFLKESANWDFLISPNEYSTEIFRRAFSFNKEILETGYPRNDFLYQSNNQKEILKLKNEFCIPIEKKVILYAPTWRDDQYDESGQYKFNLELDLTRLKEALSDEYIVILRLHYLVASKLELSNFEGFVYDFSHSEDIRKLYLISDLLITDYSSVFFDFANLRRPMIFFAYDIEDYRDRLRGFYFDFEKHAPGPLVKTTEEVIHEIKNLETNGYALPLNFDKFYMKFCNWEDGQATKRIVEKLLGGK